MKKKNVILTPPEFVFDKGNTYTIGDRNLRYVKMDRGDYMFRDQEEKVVRVTKADLRALDFKNV